MLTVCIVDDEPLSRDGLRRLIDWESLGFVIGEVAADGLEAQRRIAAAPPDVLLTDIKMPFVDGIELIRWVRERHPQIASIILSGYDEFDLAREALRLGAESYLLKPVEPSDLVETLLRIRRRLEEDERRFQELMRLRQLVRGEAASTAERAIALLLRGLPLEPDHLEQLRDRGLEEDRRHISVALCECLPEGILAGEAGAAARRSFWGYMKEHQAEVPPVVIPESDFRFAVVDWSVSRNEATASLRSRVEAIGSELVEEGIPSLAGGIAQPRRRFSELSEAYREAEQALRDSIRRGPGNIRLFTPDTGQSAPVYDATITEAIEVVSATLRNRRETDLREALDRVSELFVDRELPPRVAEGILVHLIFTAFEDFRAAGVDEALPPKWALALAEGLVAYGPVATKTAAVRSELIGALQEVSRIEAPMNKRRVSRAQEIILERYDRFDLSLDEVAEEVGTSPNYLSSLLKAQTGKGFVDYVTDVRIGRAKELLSREDLKTYEVSRLCGYQHPSYFSTVFRSQVGQTPSQFRENLKHADE